MSTNSLMHLLHEIGLRCHSLMLAVAQRRARRTNTVGLGPIILHSRRQGCDPREEARDLPHVWLAERVAPGGHARIANTVANNIVGMPLRIINWIENELRHRRIKRMFQRARLIV